MDILRVVLRAAPENCDIIDIMCIQSMTLVCFRFSVFLGDIYILYTPIPVAVWKMYAICHVPPICKGCLNFPKVSSLSHGCSHYGCSHTVWLMTPWFQGKFAYVPSNPAIPCIWRLNSVYLRAIWIVQDSHRWRGWENVNYMESQKSLNSSINGGFFQPRLVTGG